MIHMYIFLHLAYTPRQVTEHGNMHVLIEHFVLDMDPKNLCIEPVQRLCVFLQPSLANKAPF